MRMFKTLVVLALTAVSLPMMADSEAGLILGLEAEKKLTQKFSIGMEADMRTRNNLKTMDRWNVGIGAEYKFTKWLKASAGYNLLNTNFREKITYKTSGALKKWRPSYWGIKHRFNAAITGDYKFSNNIHISLRERWQYTLRPGKDVDRFVFSDLSWEEMHRSEKGKHQLRSRLQIEYDKKRALFTPYISLETYHSWAIEKIRYTVGTDVRLNKQHSLSFFYRYQDMKNVDEDDYDPNMHYISAGYKFKF